jgi:hypothetical protein
MANMTAKGKSIKRKFSEEEIDKTVVGQADNNSLARLHRERCVEEWLMRIIRERIELEEFAFVEAKREIAVKGSL